MTEIAPPDAEAEALGELALALAVALAAAESNYMCKTMFFNFHDSVQIYLTTKRKQ